jgi:hypothetical protein
LNLFTQPAGSGERRALIKFNPSGSVSDATLYLHVVSTGPGVTIYVHRVTTDWSEFSANWNTAFIVPWNNPGGDYISTPIISFQPADSCTVPLNITSLVQDWVATPASNFGITLIAVGPAGSQTTLTAREGATDTPSLVITP